MSVESGPASLDVTVGPIANGRKVYESGSLRDLRVPFREIPLSEASGEEPLRVYDTSGAYSDPASIDISKGLEAARARWVEARGDVERYEGRQVKPEDNGVRMAEVGSIHAFPNVSNTPLRGKNGESVTQLTYARRGELLPQRWNTSPSAKISSALKSPIRSAKVNPLAPIFLGQITLNLCVKKLPRAAPSSRVISTTQSSSR